MKKIINANARTIWNATLYHYVYKTAESRTKYIESFVKRAKEMIEYKENKKQARKNFKNPAKVGDILVSSWGYDQTNIDYYQVLAVKNKTIKIREIGYATMECTNWEQHLVTPGKDQFVKDSPELTRLVQPSGTEAYSIKINECSYAWPWDGKPDHKTSYA